MDGLSLLGAQVIKLDPVTITAKAPSAPEPFYGPTLEQARGPATPAPVPVAAAAGAPSGFAEWMKAPAWAGSKYPRWQVGAAGTAGSIGLVAILAAIFRR